ncbi:ZC21C protein, partial [Bucco capensis]|nr:ZC21C protein [Bucco capensis]
LEHQNSFQHELISHKEGCLKDLYVRKSQSYSCFQSAEGNQYSFRHGGSCSAKLQSKYLASQTKPLPVKLLAKRKEGVDRAYPLKPIFHHKDVSVPVVNTAQVKSSPHMEEAPNSRPSSMNNGKPPEGRPQLPEVLCPWTAQPKQPASHLYRRGQAYILKLEAEGRNMEEEIRKKEALLGEKLRRTKEVLRRIQRGRELVKAEKRERDTQRTHEQKATRHSEEKTYRVTVRPGDGVFSGLQSAETTITKPGTTIHPQKFAMGKLKKEQLVASNSKIQDCVPREHLTSCSKLGPKHSPSPLSDQDSGDYLSAEVLYLEAASAVEQGELRQCSFCGRKFVSARLEKHTSICSKNQGSKRKVFDSSKARARGTDLEEYQQWKGSETPQNGPPRKNNWRQKHEIFIQTMRQARQMQRVLSKGKVSNLPLLPPIENPDYIACPYCSRRFAPQAAERHIPKCKTIKNRPPPPPQRKR